MSVVNRLFVKDLDEAVHYYKSVFELSMSWRGESEAVLVTSDVCLIIRSKSISSEVDSLLTKRVRHIFYFSDDFDRVSKKAAVCAQTQVSIAAGEQGLSCNLTDKFGLQWILLCSSNESFVVA